MNKKLLSIGIIVLSGLFLTGCSSSKSVAKLSVDSESYIIQKEDKKDSKTTTLALEVTLENTSKKTLDNIYQGDFSLHDKDGNQISASTGVYDQSGKFKTMQGFSLNPGKKQTEYLAFDVDRGKKYELHYKPSIYTKKKIKDSIVEIDTSKASDSLSEMKNLVASYVNQVFMNKTSDTNKLETKDGEEAQNLSINKNEKETALDININKAKEDFETEFSKRLVSDLQSTGATYEPSSDEIKKVISAVQQRNFSKGKVEYNVAELFPTSATIYIKPKVITLDNIDMTAIIENKMKKGDTTDINEAFNSAAKVLIQELPKEIEKAETQFPSTMPDKGYELSLSKNKEGKWSFETSDYSYEDLETAFMAGEDKY